MRKNIFTALIPSAIFSAILMTVAVSAYGSSESACPNPNLAGAQKKSVSIARLVQGEGSLKVITTDSKGNSLKIPDTLCFSKEKLARLEASRQTKEPVRLTIKDRQILDIN
jgi:hypothetical protein